MSWRTTLPRVFGWALVLGCLGAWTGELYVALDLFGFEVRPLLDLMGTRGLISLVALNLCIAVIVWRGIRLGLSSSIAVGLIGSVVTVASLTFLAWLFQWMFMPTPLTVRLTALFNKGEAVALPAEATRDFDGFSLTRNAQQPAPKEKLRLMYARVRINSDAVYAQHPIGATIDRYATKYGIDPAYIFFRNYLNSWYGEATSGPLPFLQQMTGETVRDVVQIHLPSWFVESSLRRSVISSATLQNYTGATLAFKARYALHKATLDVSSQPFDLNTFSDIFLVLKEYPQEFDDILATKSDDPVRAALRDAFLSIRDTAMVPPYPEAYGTKAYDDSYYDQYRSALKKFSRAAYYLCALDFDFATRVQALLSKYESDYYAQRLGAERWTKLPHWQQIAMLAMVRDLYQTNVGHLAYNLYALPELNCSPLDFVAKSALATLPQDATLEKVWRPKNYDVLWAGAGYQLHVLNEVLIATSNPPIPGIDPTETLSDARQVLTSSR